ncbi:MAG: TetR/AcrR family transcriptional regulator [Phycisphaerales bacterium]
MRVSSREKIIQTAHDLFYRDGFLAVGLDQILDEVGVTKTTFYNHFESKEGLVLETLRWHDQWWKDKFREMLRRHGGDTPRGQLEAIPEAIEETLTTPGFNGCIFVNVAVQFPLPHDPAHVAAARHKVEMETILRELAGYAGADDAAALASELALIIEGAYVTRQVSGRPDTGEIARRLVRSAVDRRLPSG